jgi:hypothetical protein
MNAAAPDPTSDTQNATPPRPYWPAGLHASLNAAEPQGVAEAEERAKAHEHATLHDLASQAYECGLVSAVDDRDLIGTIRAALDTAQQTKAQREQNGRRSQALECVVDLHAALFDGATALPDRPLDTTWEWMLSLVRKDVDHPVVAAANTALRELEHERDEATAELAKARRQLESLGRRLALRFEQETKLGNALVAVADHVDWKRVTYPLTTVQREAWADAIDTGLDPDDPKAPKADRWWKCSKPSCKAPPADGYSVCEGHIYDPAED